MTVKGKYLGDTEYGWRLVAVLRVIKQFSSHDEAASWYRQQRQALPANCLVDGNPPKRLALTHRNPPKEIKEIAKGDAVLMVQEWDEEYHKRIAKWPDFRATEAEFMDLRNPPQVSRAHMIEIFDRIPGTQNPPIIKPDEMEQLRLLAKTHGL